MTWSIGGRSQGLWLLPVFQLGSPANRLWQEAFHGNQAPTFQSDTEAAWLGGRIADGRPSPYGATLKSKWA